MGASIRRAGPQDLALLVPLVAAMHEHEGLATDLRSEAALKSLLEDPRAGFALVAAGPQGTFVGYVLVGFGFSVEFHGRDGFVDELFVEPSQRRRGLAKELLAAAERECERAGVAALHLEVDHGNAAARALYEQVGYRAHPRHLMTKWLPVRGEGPPR